MVVDVVVGPTRRTPSPTSTISARVACTPSSKDCSMPREEKLMLIRLACGRSIQAVEVCRAHNACISSL